MSVRDESIEDQKKRDDEARRSAVARTQPRSAPRRVDPGTAGGNFPDVPTSAEAGLKDFNATNWFGIAAPKGTPQPVIDKLYAEVKKALASPDLAKRFADQGAEPSGISPAEFQVFVKAETERWGKIIRAAGVKPE